MEHAYLIGKDIAHSKSPDMYNALFAHLGLDWVYDARDLSSEDDATALLGSDEWLFLNATTPYKPLALTAAEVKAASVQLTGGANLLLRVDGKIVGLNTDGVGCVRHIQHEGFTLAGKTVVVCGTGPTSLAIFLACARAGAQRITLLGRSRHKTHAVLTGFVEQFKELAYATLDITAGQDEARTFREAYEQPTFAFGTYETSTREIAAADIVIDATPLGMHPDDPLPFNDALLGGQELVYDVVYGHGKSKLLAAASRAGCAVLDGQGMLVAQAVENVLTVFDAHKLAVSISREECFSLMHEAALFTC